MGKHSINLGSKHPKRDVSLTRRADPCLTDFYRKPTASDTVEVTQEVLFEWNPACLGSPPFVDITIYAPHINGTDTFIGRFQGVDFSKGSFLGFISPSWYNNRPTIDLQLSITIPGDDLTPGFLVGDNTLMIGPIFKATFNETNTEVFTGNSSNNIVPVGNLPKEGLTKGQVAAAVLLPLLAVAAIIAGYVWHSRRKEAARRKEYRENLDQRMSVAPGADWAPISAAGASAAIRHSMAFSSADRNTRASSFFGRPSSTFGVDPPQEMRQTRMKSNYTSSDGHSTRTSRISFADTTKPSHDRPAVPPLPAAYRRSAYEGETGSPENGVMSPTQREGAFVLDDDSIRDRLSGASANNGRSSMDLGRDVDTLPALAMMRANDRAPNNEVSQVVNQGPTPPSPVLTREPANGTYSTYSIGAYSGNDNIGGDSGAPSYFTNAPPMSSNPDEALRIYAARSPQPFPVTTTASPFSGFAAGPGLAAAAGFDMSSPDAIFRAYAAGRPAAPPSIAIVSSPSTPRPLYNTTMTQGLGMRPRADTLDTIGNQNPYRDSMAPSSYSDDVGKAH